MAYRIREGITLVHVQDVYLIVSSARCWDICPYITQTNEMGELIWKELEKKREIPEIVEHIMQEYEIEDREHIEYDVNQFIQNMIESNYLIQERNDVE